MKITKTQLKQIIKEELGKVLNETDELQQQLADLNAKADAAKEAGDREAYDALVDQMIELENVHLDAGGELPLPRHKDQEDDIIARYPDPEGKNPDQVIYRWQQDEFDRHQAAWKDFTKRNKK
jgi:hypothetical protein